MVSEIAERYIQSDAEIDRITDEIIKDELRQEIFEQECLDEETDD